MKFGMVNIEMRGIRVLGRSMEDYYGLHLLVFALKLVIRNNPTRP